MPALADDADNSTQAKATARKQLKALAARLAAALQAYAASATNQDPDLAGRVCMGADSLGRADDATFATLVAALLQESQPLAAQLAKREFSTQDLAPATTLLARFAHKRTQQRLTLVAGSTARKTLVALLKRNTDLIKQMRVQLKPYQGSPTKHDVWLRFQSYTKIIEQKGGGPKNGDLPAPLTSPTA